MKSNSEFPLLPVFITIIASIIIAVGITACEESNRNNTNSYIYKVTLTKPDGKIQQWLTGPDAKREEGFITWKDKNGGTASVSGCITVEPVLVPKPKPEPKPKEEG